MSGPPPGSPVSARLGGMRTLRRPRLSHARHSHLGPGLPARDRVSALRPVLLLALLLPMAACGGGQDDDPAPTPSPSAPAEDPTATTDAGDLPLLQGETCRATIVLTGGVKAQWTGEGTVATSESGPLATYQSADPADGDPVLTLYAAGDGFTATAIINAGTAVFSTPTGEGTLDIAADGSGATVSTTVGNGIAATVDVEATFTC